MVFPARLSMVQQGIWHNHNGPLRGLELGQAGLILAGARCLEARLGSSGRQGAGHHGVDPVMLWQQLGLAPPREARLVLGLHHGHQAGGETSAVSRRLTNQTPPAESAPSAVAGVQVADQYLKAMLRTIGQLGMKSECNWYGVDQGIHNYLYHNDQLGPGTRGQDDIRRSNRV
jgi:hypothetical protein